MKIEGNKIYADEGKYIRKKGANCEPYKIAYLMPNETIADFEEHATMEEFPMPFDNVRYGELVNAKIRARYSESQEFAILRQRDTKSQDYQEYFAYCEKCKVEARAEMEEQSKNGGIE